MVSTVMVTVSLATYKQELLKRMERVLKFLERTPFDDPQLPIIKRFCCHVVVNHLSVVAKKMCCFNDLEIFFTAAKKKEMLDEMMGLMRPYYPDHVTREMVTQLEDFFKVAMDHLIQDYLRS